MADGGGSKWRAILWALLRPALVAGIVALLVALGVTGLTKPYSDVAVDVASNTRFSGPLIVAGGLQTGNNLTMTDGSLINSKGAVTVTDGLAVTGPVAGVSAVWSGSESVAGALSVSGATAMVDLLALGAITTEGYLKYGTWLGGAIPSAASAITVTTGGYITPTGTFCKLASGGTVFTDKLAAGTAGRWLVLWNSSATSVTITDTGTIMLTGDWAAGQYDSLMLFSDGTNWIELGRNDN
jgi:hypothetical protein